MTNLEAIKAEIIYPLPEHSFQKVLADRELNPAKEYDPANPKPMELAKADAIRILVAGPNISEGGYNISVTEKKELIKLASGLYGKYGVSNPFEPVISTTRPW